MNIKENIHSYLIAEWKVNLCFACEDDITGMHLLPSFEPFICESNDENPLLTMIIDQEWETDLPAEHIKVCDTGNGNIIVDKTRQGEYQFMIRNIKGEDCAMMQATEDFSLCHCKVLGDREEQHSYGLNNAMMMAYAFASATRGTLLVHASLVRNNDKGYAFVAKSGTGKSTQTQNWLKVIPDCDLMNDDNPIIRMTEDKAYIYGSPWSGKTPCYRQVRAVLGAVTKIVRDPENYVTSLHPLIAFNTLLSSCSVMKWDTNTYRGICDTVKKVVESVNIYALHCTAAPESAQVCYEAIARS